MTPDPSVRRLRSVLALLGALAGVVTLGLVARRFERRIDRAVFDLVADADAPDGPITGRDLEDLPAPVREFFENVVDGLDEGRPPVRTARLSQRGEFRLGGPDAPWRPFVATGTYAVSPPGFVWDATIDVVPALPVRVLDSYRSGEGILRARVRSVLPVASAGPGPGMDEGELVRYLAEAVWFPTALLPAAGVEWNLPDGDLRYWRAEVTEFAYRTGSGG